LAFGVRRGVCLWSSLSVAVGGASFAQHLRIIQGGRLLTSAAGQASPLATPQRWSLNDGERRDERNTPLLVSVSKNIAGLLFPICQIDFYTACRKPIAGLRIKNLIHRNGAFLRAQNPKKRNA